MQAIAERRFREVAPSVDAWSLRIVEERNEDLAVVRGVVQPPHLVEEAGGMVTVIDGGGVGWAATPALTASGLRDAARRATDWAHRSAGRLAFDAARVPRATAHGRWRTPVARPWSAVPVADKLSLLRREAERLKSDVRIVDWAAGLSHAEVHSLLVTSDGGRIEQSFAYLMPSLTATANDGATTETRTFGGHAFCRQGGLEVLDEVAFHGAAPRITAEALELLRAPNCPNEAMDVILLPDQAILQVHESIGHPLELDRILGDERNYAGRSFVTPEMFGTFRYGSPLLDVTFDPTVAGEFGSYGFDDDGTAAERQYLIREGILLRPLGGGLSQARAALPGVACARAQGWSRPPIDRMANLNLEPGASTLREMIAAVERGIVLETNSSWSIDDSRNKFQFGCERGRLVRDGELREVVRKPGYRGVSVPFWRTLDRVGDASTFLVLGTPYCGKGEPNQAMRAGHGAPAVLFRNVEVFGGVR